MNIPTSELLALALIEANAPLMMIERARSNYYDDFKSPLATPMNTLYDHCVKNRMHRMAERVKRGDFDAQKWECDEYAQTDEGKEAMLYITGVKDIRDFK